MASTPTGSSREDRIYNFISCLIDAVGFPLGIAFFSSTTILPLLLRRLGASDLVVGSLPAVANLLTFLPGFLVVGYLNRLPRVRGYLFWVAIAERLCLLPLAPLTALWGVAHPHQLIIAVFVFLMMHTTCMGLNQPSYWLAVGKTVPSEWRGRLFGYAGGLAAFLSISIERVMSHYLGAGADSGVSNGASTAGSPVGFSYCFLIGFTILMVSMMPLGLLREPLTQRSDDRGNDGSGASLGAERKQWAAGFIHQMAGVWRADRHFRRFLRSYIAVQLSTMAMPFYILHALRAAHAGPADAAGFTGTMVFVSSFGGLLWGAWADRAGNKVVLIASTTVSAIAPLLAVGATSTPAFYAVFALLALGTSGGILAGFNIVMEFASEAHDIPIYTATANAVTAFPRAAAPLIGGAISSITGGYVTCFLTSSLLAIIGLLMAFRISEPRKARNKRPNENS